jgi:hypothetical protein
MFRTVLLLFSNIEVKILFAVRITFLKSGILPTSKLRIKRERKKPFVQRRSQLSLLCCTLWTSDKLRVSRSLEQRQNATDGGKNRNTLTETFHTVSFSSKF